MQSTTKQGGEKAGTTSSSRGGKGCGGGGDEGSSLPSFLSYYTQCDLPPRAFTQFLSKVVVVGANTSGGSKKGKSKSGSRSSGPTTRHQIDRGYVIAFEGDNVFNSLIATANTIVGNSRNRPQTSTTRHHHSSRPPRKEMRRRGGAKRTRSEEGKVTNSDASSSSSNSSSSDEDDGNGDATSDASTDPLLLAAMAANCRVISLFPKDPSAAKPLRLIITTRQVFPNDRLVCCPRSVERSRDEMLWAATQWCLIEKEAEGSLVMPSSSQSSPSSSSSSVVALSAAAVRKKHALLATPIPIGPHWPQGVDYYHGIGEVHRDRTRVAANGGGQNPKGAKAEAKKAKAKPKKASITFIDDAEEERAEGDAKEAASFASGALLAYPYNLLTLQSCPQLGEGQLEVVAAAPILAYTCFAYAGPVCDKTNQQQQNAVNANDNAMETPAALPPPAPSSSSHTSLNAPAPSESPYYLTLRMQTTVLGQGITRYFNHRYRSDAFGNVQFSSVSIPIRNGMVVEVREEEKQRGEKDGEADAAAAVPVVVFDVDAEDGLAAAVLSQGEDAVGSRASKKGTVGKNSSKSQRTTTTPPPEVTAKKASTTSTSSKKAATDSSSSSSAALSLMNLPFFITMRDINIGEPLLATSYGTAYDARLEREVFAEKGVPLPPYLQGWWAAKQAFEERGDADANEGAHHRLPYHPSDYEGEFRWDIKAGDIIVRVLSAEEEMFLQPRATAPSPPPSSSPSSKKSRLFIVRDVEAEANVLLIAPLQPRVIDKRNRKGQMFEARGRGASASASSSSASLATSTAATTLKSSVIREYIVPEEPSDDPYRAIVHYSTVAPLHEEDDYDGVWVGQQQQASACAAKSRSGGGGGGGRGKAKGILASIVLKPKAANAISTFPSPWDIGVGGEPPQSHAPSPTSSLPWGGERVFDCALDGCLWPLFSGFSADEASALGVQAANNGKLRGDDEE